MDLTICQVIQIILFSLTLAPLRSLCIIIILILGWILARVGLLGKNDEELMSRPLTGWRKKLQNLLYVLGRAICFCMGIHRVKYVGEQVSNKNDKIYHFIVPINYTFLILNILFKCNSDNSLKEKLRIIMTAVDVDAQNGLLHGEDDFLNGKLFYVFCVTAYAR